MRVAYLGPPGTFSEDAVSRCDLAQGAERCPFPSFADAYEAVQKGEADAAILPIENSLEGPIGATLDLLVRRPGLLIKRELYLPVVQYLMAAPGTRVEVIDRILSHPQPLGQCAQYLRSHFPGVPLEPTHSTADAARQVAERPGCAAVGPRSAAERYGLTILAESIQDAEENVTRFVLVTPQDEPPTGHDRTSIAFTLDRDRPGGLYEVLSEFANRKINLCKIESRPTKRSIGDYVFYVDFEGHRLESDGVATLEGVQRRVHKLYLLGSYPRADAE